MDLVCALLDTGVVSTHYSCEGHFNLQYRGAFCHHNQKAQIQFYARDPQRAAALCAEILGTVVFEDLEVRVTMGQSYFGADEPVDVDWCLEFRPKGYWDIRPQDGGMFIRVAEGWSEARARKLIKRAFKATIQVCKKGRWRRQG